MELAGLRTYGMALEKELENLNMLLMLSHFGLQVMDAGKPSWAFPSPLPPRSSLVHETRALETPDTHSLLHACVHSSCHSANIPAWPGHPGLLWVLGDVAMDDISPF